MFDHLKIKAIGILDCGGGVFVTAFVAMDYLEAYKPEVFRVCSEDEVYSRNVETHPTFEYVGDAIDSLFDQGYRIIVID
jgi:hypothetical protein